MAIRTDKKRLYLVMAAATTLLVTLFGPSRGYAVPIVTTGCADINVSCTLGELSNGGSFIVNGIQFSNFVDFIPNFGGSAIKVTPIGSPFSNVTGGFVMTPFDLNNNPWSIAGNTTMSFSALLEYDVSVVTGNPIGAAGLQANFGNNFSARGTNFIDGVIGMAIDRSPLSSVNLQVSCNGIDPIGGCGGLGAGVSASFGPVMSLSVAQSLDLDFIIGSGGGGAISVVRIANNFTRAVPEPGIILLFAIGLVGMRFVRSRASSDVI